MKNYKALIGGIVALLGMIAAQFDLNITEGQADQTVDTFDSWVSGSLARACSDYVDTRIAGQSAATARPLYTTQDHANEVLHTYLFPYQMV